MLRFADPDRSPDVQPFATFIRRAGRKPRGLEPVVEPVNDQQVPSKTAFAFRNGLRWQGVPTIYDRHICVSDDRPFAQRTPSAFAHQSVAEREAKTIKRVQ